MKFTVLLKTCIRALIRNPMRASLTILGIIIGIAAVIAMVEIGQGSAEAVKTSFKQLGADSLNIRPSATSVGGINTGQGGRASLKAEDAKKITDGSSLILRASPGVRASGQVIYKQKNWSPETIEGIAPEYLEIKNWANMTAGLPITQSDVDHAACVCLIGSTIVKNLFDEGESPIGKDIRVKNVTFKVIGVLQSKGANMMGRDQDDVVLIPWTSVRSRLQGMSGGMNTAASSSSSSSGSSSSSSSKTTTVSRSDTYTATKVSYYATDTSQPYTNAPNPRRFESVDYILAQVTNPAHSSKAIDEITPILRDSHGLKAGQLDDFNIHDMAEMSRTMSNTTTLMTNLLMIVAMISLVVGGVGIMNIMLVSVTERTKEIGLRMAVGARPGDIMYQFLLEAVLLCLAGGAFGILLGKVVSYVVSSTMHWVTMSSPSTMILAVAVSMVIGLVFGWYPAWKASCMDPIDALHHE